MIKLENFEVVGWEHVIRGMRNPMNSWEKMDSGNICTSKQKLEEGDNHIPYCLENFYPRKIETIIGPNDHSLMMKLRNAGTDHRKFMRMITVYVDITAPLYWWKEFDTYKVGTVANSCSTMHKIHEKEFTIDDFSCEHLGDGFMPILKETIHALNSARHMYLEYDETIKKGIPCLKGGTPCTKKDVWWQMIQLLPTSYNQKRTVMLNYEVLANIYKSRKNHKLDEWHVLCDWIEGLPYSELITGPTLDDIPICKEIMNEAEKRVKEGTDDET